MSSNAAGSVGNAGSFNGDTVTSDGRFVGFDTFASNLVPGDTNGFADVMIRDMGAAPVSVYCGTSTNSIACTLQLTTTGTPSAGSGSEFTIQCDGLIPQQPALLFYSTHGSGAVTVRGGTLCSALPVRRTRLGSSGGTPGGGCNGSNAFDFNRWMRVGADPGLRSGDDVCAQIWSRDPGSPGPGASSFSPAVAFVIEP